MHSAIVDCKYRFFIEANQLLRQQWWQFWMFNYQVYWVDQLLFIDECGFTARTADKQYGIGLIGNRVSGACHGQRSFKYTGSLAISSEGVIAFNLIDGMQLY